MKKAQPTSFAAALASALKFRGMTQAELARRANSTRATICRLLHERNQPSYDLLLRIVEALPELRDHIISTTPNRSWHLKQGVSK